MRWNVPQALEKVGELVSMLHRITTVQVSDTTDAGSSSAAGKKINRAVFENRLIV